MEGLAEYLRERAVEFGRSGQFESGRPLLRWASEVEASRRGASIDAKIRNLGSLDTSDVDPGSLALAEQAVEALRQRPGAQAASEPTAWREHVEQRIRHWRQRTVNRTGDQLALDDMMSADSIEDLIDYVCDEWSSPAGERPAQAEPMTDEQIDSILDSPGSAAYLLADDRERLRLFARAVEAAILSARERPGAQAPSTAAVEPKYVHESWWLLEATAPPRPLYYAGPIRGRKDTRGACTEDANKAVRFPTEEAAKLTIAHMVGADTSKPVWPLALMNSGWKATEHIFDYTPFAAPSTGGAETERDAFEAWAAEQGFPLGRLDIGDGESYRDLRSQGVWDAWQARAALQSPAASPASKEDGQ
jgi:hypothetical protein